MNKRGKVDYIRVIYELDNEDGKGGKAIGVIIKVPEKKKDILKDIDVTFIDEDIDVTFIDESIMGKM